MQTRCAPSHLPRRPTAKLLATLCHVSSRKWAQNIRKDLPVLLIAGTADPVGDYGAGVRKSVGHCGDAGVHGPELRNLARCPP